MPISIFPHVSKAETTGVAFSYYIRSLKYLALKTLPNSQKNRETKLKQIGDTVFLSFVLQIKKPFLFERLSLSGILI